MPLTLQDAARLSQDMLVRGVVETVIEESAVLRYLPFVHIVGIQLTQQPASCAAFRRRASRLRCVRCVRTDSALIPLEARFEAACQRPHPQFGQFIPCSAIKQTASGFRGPPTPLLEEECHTTADTSVAQGTHPVRVAGPVMQAALTTGNQPVYAVKVQVIQRPKQGFRTYEANVRRHLP